MLKRTALLCALCALCALLAPAAASPDGLMLHALVGKLLKGVSAEAEAAEKVASEGGAACAARVAAANATAVSVTGELLNLQENVIPVERSQLETVESDEKEKQEELAVPQGRLSTLRALSESLQHKRAEKRKRFVHLRAAHKRLVARLRATVRSMGGADADWQVWDVHNDARDNGDAYADVEAADSADADAASDGDDALLQLAQSLLPSAEPALLLQLASHWHEHQLPDVASAEQADDPDGDEEDGDDVDGSARPRAHDSPNLKALLVLVDDLHRVVNASMATEEASEADLLRRYAAKQAEIAADIRFYTPAEQRLEEELAALKLELARRRRRLDGLKQRDIYLQHLKAISDAQLANTAATCMQFTQAAEKEAQLRQAELDMLRQAAAEVPLAAAAAAPVL